MGLMRQEIIEIARLIEREQMNSIVMLGVQTVLEKAENIEKDYIVYGIDYNRPLFDKVKKNPDFTAIDILKTLNCVEIVDAIDYSNYEGANIIFDLNANELSPELKGKYNLVIDGGTLEHVFNQANAINNMNQLISDKGYIYHMLPCAGWVNHGFFNYSPSLFQDVYHHENGFDLEEIKLCFKQPKGQKSRLLYSQDCRMYSFEEINKAIYDNITNGGVMLYCLAKKMREINEFCQPIQTMYVEMYADKKVEDLDLDKFVSDLIKVQELYMYGGGYWGEKIMDQLIKKDLFHKVLGILDSNIEKYGTSIKGKKVLFPTAGLLKDRTCVLISSFKYEVEIKEILCDLGVKETEIICISNYLR